MCYSYVLVCTHMSSVCHLYILVCHPYVTRMYLYVILMSLVCGFTMNRKNIFSFAVHIYGCSFVAKLVEYFFFSNDVYVRYKIYIICRKKSFYTKNIYIYIYIQKKLLLLKKTHDQKIASRKITPWKIAGRLTPNKFPPGLGFG